MGGHAVDISEATFDTDVLRSEQPVLVDFWAPWCPPCRQIAPMVEQLAEEYLGAVKIAKVNIDDNQALAMTYGVESIPTLMVFNGGQVVDRFRGVQSKSRLQQALDAAKG